MQVEVAIARPARSEAASFCSAWAKHGAAKKSATVAGTNTAVFISVRHFITYAILPKRAAAPLMQVKQAGDRLISLKSVTGRLCDVLK